MEFVRFISQDFQHWFGFAILIIIVLSPFLIDKEKRD